MKKDKSNKKERVIIGVVKAVEEDDEITGLVILSDYEEYHVVENKTGRKLYDAVNKNVEVTGRVETDDDGDHHITISDFEIFETEDEDDYDDFGDERFDEDF